MTLYLTNRTKVAPTVLGFSPPEGHLSRRVMRRDPRTMESNLDKVTSMPLVNFALSVPDRSWYQVPYYGADTRSKILCPLHQLLEEKIYEYSSQYAWKKSARTKVVKDEEERLLNRRLYFRQ